MVRLGFVRFVMAGADWIGIVWSGSVGLGVVCLGLVLQASIG